MTTVSDPYILQPKEGLKQFIFKAHVGVVLPNVILYKCNDHGVAMSDPTKKKELSDSLSVP